MTQMQNNPDPLANITKLFDLGTAIYVANKHRGGKNTGKGATYEDYFAVTQLAAHAQKEASESFNTSWKGQCFGMFIDDLVITYDGTLGQE